MLWLPPMINARHEVNFCAIVARHCGAFGVRHAVAHGRRLPEIYTACLRCVLEELGCHATVSAADLVDGGSIPPWR